MRADQAPAGADVRERLQPLAHVLAAAGDRRQRAGRRGRGRRTSRSISSSIVAVSSDRFSALGSSGAKSGSPRSEPEHGVQLAGDARRGRARAARTPSRSSRHSSQPSRAPARYSCSVPSVASISRPSYSYQPASGAMCANPRVGEEAQQLELGVDARLEPAEHLQDQALAEDDRRVGLLDADRPHVDRAAEPGRRRCSAQRKRSVPSPRATLGRAADAVQQLARRARRRRARRRPSSRRRSAITRSVQPSAAGRRPSGSW